MDYLLLILGFIFLVKGADLLVDGASSIAERYKIPHIVIGLTIVSFGTSAPELVVNLFASVNGNNDLNLGNIIGSNISNILLILGIAGSIYPLHIKKGTVWKEIPFALLAVLILGIAANDMLINGNNFNVITRGDALMLLAFFVIFLYYTFGISKIEGVSGEGIKKYSVPVSITLFLIGLIGLVIGGEWIVSSAVSIAQSFGLSEAFIGLSVVAIGTSLPELATSVVAAMRKNVDIAVGNVVGSNIFNSFWIIGVCALVNPIHFNTTLNSDVLINIAATLLLFFAAFVGRKHLLDRWQCGFYLFLYAGYITFLVFRG